MILKQMLYFREVSHGNEECHPSAPGCLAYAAGTTYTLVGPSKAPGCVVIRIGMRFIRVRKESL